MAWYGRRCVAMLEGCGIRKAARSTLASRWEKETKKNNMFWEVIGRNSTTLAPLMAEEKNKKEIMEEESFKCKSLYLCFEEHRRGGNTAHVIRTIRLSHVLAPPTDGDHGSDDLKLRTVAHRCGAFTDIPHCMRTGIVGSKIIFSGGHAAIWIKKVCCDFPQFSPSKEVFVFETDPSIDPNPRLQPSPVYDHISRPHPVLVDVGGKICRFGGQCDCESFEVFDQTHEKWMPLDVPPRKYPNGFTHAIADTKILLWGRNQTGVYMFDVTHPEKGWTELNSCLGSYMPYIDGYDQLFVRLNYRDGDGDGFLMFSYDRKQSETVQVFHMSHKCDSLKPMEPLQLPQFPPKFHGKELRCKFFHLGGQNVGLVFCRDSFDDYVDDDYELRGPESDDDEDGYDYRGPDWLTQNQKAGSATGPDDDDDDGDDHDKDDGRDNYNDDGRGYNYDDGSDNDMDDGRGYNYDDGSANDNGDGPDNIDKERSAADNIDKERLVAVVIIFEYKIDKESMDIKYKLLSTRCPEYSTKDPEVEAQKIVFCSQLIGAYVQ